MTNTIPLEPLASAGSVSTPAQFEAQLTDIAAPLAGEAVLGLRALYLSWRIGAWLDTGLQVKAGDRLTFVLEGGVEVSRALGIRYSAELATWARIGERGPIFRALHDTQSFTVEQDGPLQLKLYPRDRWLDASGRYRGEPPAFNPDEGGGVNVGIIHWRPGTDVAEVLGQAAAGRDAAHWASRELARLRTPRAPLPGGWQELWELGPSTVFSAVTPAQAGRAPTRAIRLHTRDDVSILQKDADLPLSAHTTLSWKWKVDRLPSSVAEDQIHTHDYLSIAVEFDNGRDLTFYWSRDLPEGTHFHCPLPGWHDRETHVVVRSGTADLGQWLCEEQNILDHYRTAIGGEPPARIRRVWLIGVSLFQHGEGEATFGDILLRDVDIEKRLY